MKHISSLQNSLVKNIIKLQDKAKERTKQQLVVIEGVREVLLAIKGGYNLQQILFCEEIFTGNYIDFSQKHEVISISKEVYQKIAYRTTTEGILAIAKTKDLTLKNLEFYTKNPLILVAEGIEKPGNLGAILRTADAAKVDAVLVVNPNCDVYNPNVIRSSIGCIFTNQIAVATNEEALQFLKINNIQIFATTLQNSNVYTAENYKFSCAIVVGSEANGITEIWRTNATQNIIIPMLGEIDSMNVSVAAAIVIFEAIRQRNQINP